MKLKIEQIIELEKANPMVLRDYCYYDGCPTDWYRKAIEESIKGERISYWCVECETKRYYSLKRNLTKEVGK